MDKLKSASVTPSRTGGKTLLAGALAALLASTCCLGPLVLLMMGISGAWIGNLAALEPYRLLFMAIAGLALFMAWRQIWRPEPSCAPGQVCAVPQVRRGYKLLFGVVVMLLLIALGFPLVAPWFY